MFCIIWEYQVESSHSKGFEEFFTRKGPWFKFFESCEDYLGHDFLRSDSTDTYVVIDKWMDKEAYKQFVAENQASFDALNVEVKGLCLSEKQLGTYEAL